MIFEQVTFYKNDVIDHDRLGNPIYKEVAIGDFHAAITQWTKEEIELEYRAITNNLRKMITHAPREVIEEFTHVYIGNKKYVSKELKSDFKRWRLCYVKEVH